MANINILAIICIVVTGMAMVFDTIGLAIPYWYVQTVKGKGSWSYGLWDACIHDDVQRFTQCADVITYITPRDINLYDEVVGTFKAVRAMEILGMLASFGALLCLLAKLIKFKDQPILPKIAAGLSIFAGVVMIIGTILWASNTLIRANDVPEFKLHAGFALCVIAGVISLVAGVITFLSTRYG